MSEEKKYTGLDVNDCCQKYGIEAVAMKFIEHIDEKDLGPEGKAILGKKRQLAILNKKDATVNSVPKCLPPTKEAINMITQDTEKSIKYSKILDSLPIDFNNPCEGFNVELFPKFLKDYSESLIRNRPKQATTITTGIFGAMSVLAGPNLVLKIGSKEHYSNLLALVIAPSGSGKSRALDLGIRLAKYRDGECLKELKRIQSAYNFDPKNKDTIEEIKKVIARMVLAPTKGSLKGLCDHIMDANALVVLDEYSGYFKAAKDAEYNIGGLELLIEISDPQNPYKSRTGKDGRLVKEHPFLSIVAASTPSSIKNVLKIDGTGFVERHLLFDVKEERKIRDLSRLVLEVDTVAETLLYNHLDELASQKAYTLSADALLVLNLINQKIFDLSEKYGTDGSLYSFYVRWLDSVCEIATLIEFCDFNSNGHEVSAQSMLAAYSYVHYSIISTISLKRMFYINSLSPRRKKIELAYEVIKDYKVAKNAPMPYKEILMLDIIERVQECKDILELLIESGRIERVEPNDEYAYQIVKD